MSHNIVICFILGYPQLLNHPVIAVSTEVVASDEQSCHFPVVFKVDSSSIIRISHACDNIPGLLQHVTAMKEGKNMDII